MNKKARLTVAGIGGCIVLLVMIYGAGIIFFSNHLFFHTFVNGINCSMQSPDVARENLDKELKNYTLYVIGRNDYKEEIKGYDVGLQIEWNHELEAIVKRQNVYSWPVYLFKKANYDCIYKTLLDDEKLRSQIKSWSEIQDRQKRLPKNAKIGEYDAKAKKYFLEPAEQGSYLLEENVYRAAKEAILTLRQQLNLEDAGCYLKVRIDDDDERLLHVLEEMNRYVSTEIRYEFGDKTEILDADKVHTWISRKNYVVSIDEDAVLNYVRELAKQYDTAYRKHSFLTADGEEIVISQGHYGWWMNRKEEADELLQLIKQGTKSTRKAIYFQEAASFEKPDYGNSYVELDLSKQHLYLWIDGELFLESDFVSGNLLNGMATPEGIYPITYKERDTVLRGTGYASPVSYWMPFNGDIGMHDASWRKNFGGNIYVNNGSHGCINLPSDVAQQIYEQVYTGMAVICYYSSCE